MTKINENRLQKVLGNFELFAKNFIFITDNEGQKIKFNLNDAQLEIDKLMEENRFINIMKARQSGASTFVIARSLWRCLVNPNENILIVSYKGESKDALFQMMKQMNEDIPREQFPGVFPTIRRDNRGELFFSNGSRISSVTAGNKSVGRGSTYSAVHLSEFAFYSNQESQLLSIEQSLAKGSHSQLTIESTSNGASNHHYKLSMQSLKDESRYVPYFIPFYHKLYRKQFAYEYDEAEAWYKATNKGAKLRTDSLDEDEETLHKAGATLRTLQWRRWKLVDISLEQFQQEYCSTPIESFVTSGSSVFSPTKVIEKLANLIEPLSKDEVSGELPDHLLKYVGRGLNIFYMPEKGKKYYFGVDVASGSGNGDNSAISVFDEEGQQVMSFYSNKIPIYVFSEIVYDLGHFYNYAFIAVERNSYGIVVLQKLREEMEIPYMNLAKMRVFDQRGRRRQQLGFHTTESSKQLMIQTLKEEFEQGQINIECENTLYEFQLFQETQSGKLGNKRGIENRDDMVIATGISIWGRNLSKWYVD